jgi:hypothetical protein
MNWELDRHVPGDRYYPSLISYLGHEPWPEPATLSAGIRAQRLRRGLTVAQLAALLSLDEGSLAAWERGKGPKHAAQKATVAAFVEGKSLPRKRRQRSR